MFTLTAVVLSMRNARFAYGCKKARFTRVLKWPTRAKKGPIYTQTRQINYYYFVFNGNFMPTNLTRTNCHDQIVISTKSFSSQFSVKKQCFVSC
jgi:hypothetical protein